MLLYVTTLSSTGLLGQDGSDVQSNNIPNEAY